MRVYGRTPVDPLVPNGPTKWVMVETDENGLNDIVYVVGLAQVLLLNLGESPFWANYGIPAKQSVLQQVFPDYYVILTQGFYSRYFASLIVAKRNDPTPTYDISIITHVGVKLNYSVPIPT